MDTRRRSLSLVLSLSLLLVGLLFISVAWGRGWSVVEAAGPRYVATSGSDAGNDCSVNGSPCRTIQRAVEQAAASEEIRVATGVYTGVIARPAPGGYGGSSVITQVVYLSRTVTLRGGYTTTNWTTSYPITQPTTLDAEGKGRVLFIPGSVTPWVEGLRLTHGNAAGLGGWAGAGPGDDGGGGVYILSTAATITGSTIVSNTGGDYGGGLFVDSCNVPCNATFGGNTIMSNTAGYQGGGAYAVNSAPTISGNLFVGNTVAGCVGCVADGGGALCLVAGGFGMVSGNTIQLNTATSRGGGVYLEHGAHTLTGNSIVSNTVTASGLYVGGGGLCSYYNDVVLNGNTFAGNTSASGGGGLYFRGSNPTLSGNVVMSNTANYRGGGLYLDESDPTLSGDTVVRNVAGSGGGLSLQSSDASLVNTLIADNSASGGGSGLYVWSGSPRLRHTTLARNTGSEGIYVYADASAVVSLTNTIVASHTVGINVLSPGVANLESTLWDGNGSNWSGAGTISRLHDYFGPVGFVNSSGRDYHLRSDSAAANRGVNAGVTTDLDGKPRPHGSAPDLGAYELQTDVLRLEITKAASPAQVEPGSTVTYTLWVTNTGDVILHTTITDTLPDHVTYAGDPHWTPSLAAGSGFWTQQLIVTANWDYTGTLTNTLQATTQEGPGGQTQATVWSGSAAKPLYLPMIRKP